MGMKNLHAKQWIGPKKTGCYVLPAAAAEYRKAQEDLIKNLCDEHKEICRKTVTAAGIEESTARRLLADLRKRGVVQVRTGKPFGTMYYRWNPRGLIGSSWVKSHNHTPLGQHGCKL